MILKLLAALILAIVVGVVGSVLVGGMRWRAATEAREEALAAARAEGSRLPRGTLPECVARYLERAIPAGSADIGMARLRQVGTFQMGEGEGEDGWRQFEGTEVMSAPDPGFYWDASIVMAPGVAVRVRDSYIQGSAEMVAKILAVVSVVDAEDDADLRQGALSRYLAEAAWIPTRLGTGPGLTWRGVDSNSAQATLVDRGTSVSLRFTFDATGDLMEVYGFRPREVEGRYVETPWIGRFRDHQAVGGYRIPLHGEVAWVIDGEEVPYWRGTIVEAEFLALAGEPSEP